MPVPYTFGTATAAIPLSNLDANFNTPVTIGNTTVGLGNTVTTVGNLTLTNVTITSGTINAAVVDSGYVANSVVYADSTGVLTAGSANLTFNGTTLTAAAITSTGVATFSAGTVSAPAITTTGDTNTGIYFPAADTIAFTEGGVESMRIDSSGNVGIGTSSPAAKFEVSTGGATKARITTTIDNNADLDFYTNGVFRGLLEGNSAGMFLYSVPSIPIVFGTNNAERMRIDSSGNVGIGTTSISRRLTVSGKAQFTSTTATNEIYLADSSTSTIDNQYIGSVGNDIRLGTGNQERMRITSGGEVGINATSPAVSKTPQLFVRGNSNTSDDYIATFEANNATAGIGISYQRISSYDNANTAPLIFDTNGSERMRITSGGALLVNTTNVNPGGAGSDGQVVINTLNGGQAALTCYNAGTGAVNIISLENGNGQVGRIQVNGSATSYLTSSDYRLKENIQPMTGALAKVTQLKPCTFNWKVDGSAGQGFIAHELQEFAPYAVSGEKDGKEMQGVDYGKITPLLTAALQEAIAKIESLEARLVALESK